MTRLQDREVRLTSDREPAAERAAPVAAPLTAEAVLRLQRSAGNAAVQRALAPAVQRKDAAAEETTGGGLGDWLFPPTEGEENDTGASPGAVWRWLAWAGIGMADIVTELVDAFGFEGYDISADFLRHYMSGRGAEYQLEMPEPWQQAIAKKRSKPGTYRDVSAYDMNIPDMKNSLGHFDLKVEQIAGGGKLYTVTDKYHFPAMVKGKAVFHGFEVGFFGLLPPEAQNGVNAALAKLGTWKHPGGKLEKFEVVKLGGKWTFILPQQWLVDSGVDFPVRSSFMVAPDGSVGGGEDDGWF